MPQPDVRSTIVAGPLQSVSVAYRNLAYIAALVFPIIPNVPPKAKILKYLKGAWFRDEAGIRGAGSRANRGGYPTSYIDVITAEYAFAKEVTDEDRKNARVSGAPPIQPEMEAVEFATDKIDMKKEKLVKALVADTTWVDGNASGDDAEGLWAPAGNTNTFLADMITGTKAIHGATGLLPNNLVIDLKTFLALKQCAEIQDKIKYTQRGVLTQELLAAIIGDAVGQNGNQFRVHVGSAIYSSAKESKAGTDFTAASIWEINSGKGMGFLYFAPPAPGLKVPSAGYQAQENYESGPRQITTWRESAEHQDVFEVAEKTHVVAVGTDCGYLWRDTYTT